jgi:hypothetical protein
MASWSARITDATQELALPICNRYVEFLFAFPSQQIPAELATPISMPAQFLARR